MIDDEGRLVDEPGDEVQQQPLSKIRPAVLLGIALTVVVIAVIVLIISIVLA